MLESKARSSLGRAKIKNLRPSDNIEEVERWQEETSEALTCIIKIGPPELFGITNLTPDTQRARMGGVLTPKGLLQIGDTLRAVRGLKNYKRELEGEEIKAPLIDEIISLLYQNPSLEGEIEGAIENEETIRDTASHTLHTIRRKIAKKNDEVREKMQSFLQNPDYKKHLQDSLIVMRGDRYCLPVKREAQGSIKGIMHDSSGSGQTVFIEPMAVVKINNELRDLEAEEQIEIEKILRALSEKVSEVAELIEANQELLSSLDFIFAKGQLSLSMEASRPILNYRGYINLKKARHPLIDQEMVVPIDIHIGDSFTTLVITGPNTGGKTVSLKTVGLLSLMAQSGLHIPSDHESEMAVFTEIFADIGDEQSIEQSLSTFSSHLTNIVEIMKNLRANSLILFDELGAGTDPQEGAALAMAILDYILKMRIPTIATTHYSQLKIYALTTEGVKNASVEFDVETLSPTYKLLIGLPGKSNAFAISERLGLKSHIIDSAKKMLNRESVEFESILQRIDEDRKEIDLSLDKARRDKEESEQLRERLESKIKKLEESKEKELTKAKEEAQAIIDETREEVDSLLKILRKNASLIPKEDMRLAEEKVKKVSIKSERKIEAETNKAAPKNLKIGDNVKIISFDTEGVVLEINEEDGKALVKSGIMKLTVKLTDLKIVPKSTDPTREQRGRLRQMRSQTISPELDIRGETVDSAIIKIDKYLDDCYIAGLQKITIIHGKGTGALREGVRDFLKSSRYVKSLEYAPMNAGGDGASIITMNNK